MNNYTLIVKDDATGRQVTHDFTSATAYKKRLEEIAGQYFTLQENTITTLVVAKLPDLFDEVTP